MRLRRQTGKPRRRHRIRKLRLAALLCVLFLLAAFSFMFGLVRAIATEIPSLDPAAAHTEVDTVVYASNGRRVLAVLRGNESRVLVDTQDIAPIMRQAIVSIEDQRFFEHNGIDLKGIARALVADIRHKSIVEGGSTITQQFVKNAYIRNQRTLARKVREAALAWQLEQKWSKDRILTAYLNTIYFGNGAYGIQQASRAYFGKGAKYLTLPQAALLAGIPSDPDIYDPVTNPRAAEERRREVLAAMLAQGKISRIQYRRANAAPMPRPDKVHLPGTQGPAAYFVNYVKEQLIRKYGAGRVFGGGLHVTTTIDLALQEKARKAIEKVLPNRNGPQAALVAMDPHTGAVEAMFGGRNFRESQFNLAAQAERQPGSSFKPIVLATAMREGISPQTELESKPVSIDAGDRIWNVTNFDHTYLGRIDVAHAIVPSDNSVFAQLTELVGPKHIVDTAHALGITSPLDPYFAIGLGFEAVNPLEMARAYSTFANDGRRVDTSLFGDQPNVVESVQRVESGKIEDNIPEPKRVLPASQAELLTGLLQNVVRFGTGRRAAVPGIEVAGKTGTTDNYADAWFVGYTPQLAVAVWVGYPDRLRPMTTEFGGQPVTGGTLPAEIWKNFVSSLEPTDGAGSFTPAPYLGGSSTWVVRRNGRWEKDNGYCRGARLIVYFSGKSPDKTADCKPNEVEVPLVVGMTADNATARLADQPLGASYVYKPAKAGRPTGIVVDQFPRRGGLSAHDDVTLVVSKSVDGLVPNFVGSTLGDARLELKRIGLHVRWTSAPGPARTILRQTPRPGVAAAKGLLVTFVVGDGSRKASH
ncbi:MAG TPA: PBP1A family penicillin-binding protein [Gaiellaceae bacterium]|nr:PBP1A family penicillin-binding protein [Gaiellaceae bacterium]